VVLFIFIISSAILALLFLFNGTVSHIYKGIPFFPFYSLGILTTYVTTFAIVPKIYYQVKEQAKNYVILSILQFIFTTGLVIWFIVYQGQGAIGMLKGAFYGNLILLPVFLKINISIIDFALLKKILKSTLSYSLPVIPYVLSNWVITMSNRIFIDQYYTTADNGIYGFSQKIASISIIITSAIAMAYNPHFFKTANTDDPVKAKNELKKLHNYIINFLLFVCFMIAFFSRDFIELFINDKYLESYKVIPLLVMGNVFIAFISLSNLSFSQEKKTKQLMYIVLFVAGINILLNFILIPPFRIYGAAVSVIISQAIYAAISYYFSRRYYFIPFNWKWISFFGILFIGLYLAGNMLIAVSVLSFILKAIIVSAILIYLYFRYRNTFSFLKFG
jgi:O-antigen/teichoic acid export membrane protein